MSDTPRTHLFCACAAVNRESSDENIGAQLVYFSPSGYVEHCKFPVLALQYDAIAS